LALEIVEAKLFAIDPVTGATTVVAEGGMLRRPEASVIDADGDVLLIEDRSFTGSLSGVVSVDPSTGTQTLVAQLGPGGRLYVDMALGPAGEIWTASTGGGTSSSFLELDPATGTILSETVVQGAVSRGIAVDRNGRVFTAVGCLPNPDCPNATGIGGVGVLELDPAAHTTTVIASDGDLSSIIDLATDQEGNLLTADYAAKAIVRVNTTTGLQEVVDTPGLVPFRLAVESDGHVIAIAQGDDSIFQLVRIDLATGFWSLLAHGIPDTDASYASISVDQQSGLIFVSTRSTPEPGTGVLVAFGLIVVGSASLRSTRNDG
jgi:streptogramin lyase